MVSVRKNLVVLIVLMVLCGLLFWISKLDVIIGFYLSLFVVLRKLLIRLSGIMKCGVCCLGGMLNECVSR